MTPPSLGLDGGQRSTLTRKLGKLLGSTTRPQAFSNIEQFDHASVIDSPLPSSATSSQRIPLFGRTKSFSTSTIASASASSDAASSKDAHSETNQSSSSLMKGSKSHGSFIYPESNAVSTSRASGRISSSSRSHRAPSRSSTTSSKFKYSRPPSPPPMYASFDYEGPIKKPRPLVLDPKKQRARSKDKAKSSKKYQPSVVGTSPLPSPASPSATQSAHPSIPSSTLSIIAAGGGIPKTDISGPARDEFMNNTSPVASDEPQKHTEAEDDGQPASSSDAIIDFQSIPSTDTLPDTPDTPGFSEYELRRRKVQKLYRTLGESVPLELVFRDTDWNKKSKAGSEIAGAPNVEWQTPEKQTHSSLSTKPASRRLSDHPLDSELTSTPWGAANQPPDVAEDEMPPVSPIQSHPQIVVSVCCSEEYESIKPVHEEGQWLTRQPKLPTRSGSLRTQTPSTSAASRSPVTLTDKSQTAPFTHHSRGKSEQTPFADTIPRSTLIVRSSSLTRPRTLVSSPTSPHLAAPFAPYIEGSELLSSHTPESSALQRKERKEGWSGEWNQGDMQDVIRKLRMLK
jgi:hypothetical protein